MSTSACQSCGASLAGSTPMNCPSCGQRPDLRTPRDKNAPRPRISLTKPVIILALGLAGMTVYFLANNSLPLSQIIIVIAAQMGLGVALFTVSTMTWLGAGDPFPVNLLRLAAIYTLTWALLLPMIHMSLVFFMLLLIPLLAFFALHIILLDTETSEAFILAALTLVLYVIATFIVKSS